MSDINMFTPGGNTVELSATSTSANVAITAVDGFSGSVVDVYNDGPNTAFLAFGNSSVTAVVPTVGNPAAGIPLASGARKSFEVPAAWTNIAAICASAKTATIYITTGKGF